MKHLNTNQLLDQAQHGNILATEHLLSRFWNRLCQMITVLLDPRLSARVDPEDIVQDAMLLAASRLPKYLEHRPVAFFPWLQSLVLEQLIGVHRCHLRAQRRSVCREHMVDRRCSPHYLDQLAEETGTPDQLAIVEERGFRIHQVLSRLNDGERKILMMRYARRMSVPAIAVEMKITEPAAKSRLWRAQQSAARLLRSVA